MVFWATIMKFILACFSFFCTLQLAGQAYWSMGADAAKVFSHTQNVYYQAPPYSLGLSVAMDAETNPQNISYRLRNTPRVGVQFYYLDYRDLGMGKVYGLMPRVSFVRHWSSCFSTDIRVAIGVAYATRHYDRVPWSDTIYNALGSNWNNMTELALNLNYKLDMRSRLSLSAGLMHVSSSAASAPNYGINNLKWGVNYSYAFRPDYKYGKTLEEAALNENRHSLSLGLGITSDKTIPGATFPVYIFQYMYQFMQPTRLALWYLGVEWEYNATKEKLLQWRSIDKPKGSIRNRSAVFLTLGREWFMGDFGLRLGGAIGYSFVDEKFMHLLKPTLIYYPFNINYADQNIWKSMYLGLGLTSFTFNAQYLELSLGTNFLK